MESMKQVELANQEWVAWNNLGANKRAECLLDWADVLLKDNTLGSMPSKMIKYQIQEALPLIATDKIMPGPTGESNELYSSGRGTFVITACENVPVVGVAGLIAGALIAGNCILLCLPESENSLAKKLMTAFKCVGIGKNVIQVVDFKNIDSIIENQSTAGVGYAGEETQAIKINKQLASRDGLIAQLIVESDFKQFSTLTDCFFVYRFITERTRTINMTAVGGNAKLLAFGSGDK